MPRTANNPAKSFSLRQQCIADAVLDDNAKRRFALYVGPVDKNGCQEWLGPKGPGTFCKFNFSGSGCSAQAFAAALHGLFRKQNEVFSTTCGNVNCVALTHVGLKPKSAKRTIPKNEVLDYVTKRFWRRVSKDEKTGCWVFSPTRPDGYGVVCWPNRGGVEGAHRFSYRIHNGDYPETMDVCHKCDNPPCVNPDHLFLGTHLNNMQDKVAKGRHRFHQGESHYRATITFKQATEMRRLFLKNKKVPFISSIFKKQPSSIRAIVLGRAFKPDSDCDKKSVSIYKECASMARQTYGKSRDGMLDICHATILREEFLRNNNIKTLSQKYNRSQQKVQQIVLGHSYVPGHGRHKNATPQQFQVWMDCAMDASRQLG